MFGLFSNKKELLNWQNLIIRTNTNKLVMTKKQLQLETVRQAERLLEIISDSQNIVNITTNVETYFSRYDLLYEKVEKLCEFEKYIRLTDPTPSEGLLILESQEYESINCLINRVWQKTISEAEKLKTTKGKLNKYKKFYEIFSKYSYRMSDANINLYKSLCENFINE
jgi:hypothetical protein